MPDSTAPKNEDDSQDMASGKEDAASVNPGDETGALPDAESTPSGEAAEKVSDDSDEAIAEPEPIEQSTAAVDAEAINDDDADENTLSDGKTRSPVTADEELASTSSEGQEDASPSTDEDMSSSNKTTDPTVETEIPAGSAAETSSIPAVVDDEAEPARPQKTTSRANEKASGTVWYMPEPSDRPLPWLGWRYSLIFVAAILGIVATLAYGYITQSDDSPKELVFRVVDANNSPISGATIHLGSAVQITDADGIAHMPQGIGTQPIKVERDGYLAVEGTVNPAEGERREIVLQAAPPPTPLPAGTPASPPSNATDATPTGLDATASAILTHPSGATAHLRSNTLAGKVLDDSGEPIQGARVSTGTTWSITGADGIYQIDRAEVDPEMPLHIFAAGYTDIEAAVPAFGNTLDVTLKPHMIKAIYLNPTITNTQDEIDSLIAIANTTEINAIVIDIKDEIVFYDTQVPLFRDAGTVNPVLDLPDLIEQLHENGIYTIARLVVFKDSMVAEQHPDLAIRSTETGEAWRDQNGVAWVNPMKQELWAANTELAVEAANLGFDEIQFDYVRFPTDGDLSTMDFGADSTEANREKTITGFVDYAWQRLIPTGAKLSADIFGYTLMVQDDLGIGQNARLLESHLDYLSPMVYPSHYGEAFRGYSPPNDYPGEVVGISLDSGIEMLGLQPKHLRPWLQDFDYHAGDKHYGAKEVRAQIDATEKAGASGWMLWTLGNPITVDALKSESGDTTPDLAVLIALSTVIYDPAHVSGLA